MALGNVACAIRYFARTRQQVCDSFNRLKWIAQRCFVLLSCVAPIYLGFNVSADAQVQFTVPPFFTDWDCLWGCKPGGTTQCTTMGQACAMVCVGPPIGPAGYSSCSPESIQPDGYWGLKPTG